MYRTIVKCFSWIKIACRNDETLYVHTSFDDDKINNVCVSAFPRDGVNQ